MELINFQNPLIAGAIVGSVVGVSLVVGDKISQLVLKKIFHVSNRGLTLVGRAIGALTFASGSVALLVGVKIIVLTPPFLGMSVAVAASVGGVYMLGTLLLKKKNALPKLTPTQVQQPQQSGPTNIKAPPAPPPPPFVPPPPSAPTFTPHNSNPFSKPGLKPIPQPNPQSTPFPGGKGKPVSTATNTSKKANISSPTPTGILDEIKNNRPVLKPVNRNPHPSQGANPTPQKKTRTDGADPRWDSIKRNIAANRQKNQQNKENTPPQQAPSKTENYMNTIRDALDKKHRTLNELNKFNEAADSDDDGNFNDNEG